ncbi:hypothetical protein D1B31_16075 [Neobacillus notoginsengisoli]|uniref:Uncharacterized protein n=1 Tax=Neobacillus notoginsengisoli TaxID=1578198 RepID=A0A417YQZ6_9BACI|nr:hypothetical protein D1B31_16075 [Neobacillus notoginsengisoli]
MKGHPAGGMACSHLWKLVFSKGGVVHKNRKGFILSQKRFINLKKWYILSQLRSIPPQIAKLKSVSQKPSPFPPTTIHKMFTIIKTFLQETACSLEKYNFIQHKGVNPI